MMRTISIALIALAVLAVLFSQSMTGEKIDNISLLVERDGVFYKKFSNEPFTGEVVSGGGRLKNGKKEGMWETYFTNGQLSSKGSYKNGESEGLWEVYSSDGGLISKGSYKNGEREGLWIYYLYGLPSSKINYKKGTQHGHSEYYKYGRLTEKGSFDEGKKTGLWLSYHQNGKLKSKGVFSNSERLGEWVFCNEKSTPIIEIEYETEREKFIFKNMPTTGIYDNGVKVAEYPNADCDVID